MFPQAGALLQQDHASWAFSLSEASLSESAPALSFAAAKPAQNLIAFCSASLLKNPQNAYVPIGADTKGVLETEGKGGIMRDSCV